MVTSSDEVRETFLNFFEDRGHLRIKGSRLVAKNDPTLLFVNSGMAPLKGYFVGNQEPPRRELTNYQACIRTKDIDDVGDRHHMTFFEMLGSWSIGGYFKERAIELAYELLTQRLGFSASDLYVTVFEGDDKLGIPFDDVSARAWEAVGIPRDHIVPQPAADNFWGPAGETGPCGPCTEVFLDSGDAYGEPWSPGGTFDTTRRYIEIWNAGVFMQFNKRADGSLEPLPFTSVDTGSGLERIAMAANGLENVYETDLLVPVIGAVQDVLAEVGELLPRHRVIADHVRASCMIMAEGVELSNEGAGYIPRRLLRKCISTAYRQGVDSLDLAPVVDAAIGTLAPHYPLLNGNRSAILSGVEAEIREFGSTIQRGVDRLEKLLKRHKHLSGADAFHLASTYGLPFEITKDIASEQGVEVHEERYQEEFAAHQARSRASGSRARKSLAEAAVENLTPTEFVGYEDACSSGTVARIYVDGERVGRLESGQTGSLFLDRTPFFATRGGQVGDKGSVASAGAKVRVVDTWPILGDRYVHVVEAVNGTLREGERVTATIDAEHRIAVMANHSGTHLLQSALRAVLGTHVRQAGSLVESNRLRFDFTHDRALSATELGSVERLVNQWILDDYTSDISVMTYDDAIQVGALPVPNEVYEGPVRVVSLGDVSRELCGGTHVAQTKTIGAFAITSQQSVSAGVRRLTAVTRAEALDEFHDRSTALRKVAGVLGSRPGDVVDAVTKRLASTTKATVTEDTSAAVAFDDLEAGLLKVRLGRMKGDGKSLHSVVRAEAATSRRVAIAWIVETQPRVAVAVPDSELANVSAVSIVRELMERLGGSGGGTADRAQGGGGELPAGASVHELTRDAIVAVLQPTASDESSV